jgi:indolepyruvate ferredoxin oxidoreductase beta subunit
MIFNCLITGVGGQGTVLLSRLMGQAAMKRGLEVRGAETIGMAQRGGSVVSHIRIECGRTGSVPTESVPTDSVRTESGIHSPLVPKAKADIVIAFEPGEAVRVLSFLSASGKLLVLNRGVMPVTGSLGGALYDPARMVQYLKEAFGKTDRLVVLDGEAIVKKCGSAKVVNTALLGAALGMGLLPFGEDDAAQALAERLSPPLLEINLKALETGKEYAYAF